MRLQAWLIWRIEEGSHGHGWAGGLLGGGGAVRHTHSKGGLVESYIYIHMNGDFCPHSHVLRHVRLSRHAGAKQVRRHQSVAFT